MMENHRTDFERLNRDSHAFRRSRKGTYTNPAIARDWKWFELGAIAALRAQAAEGEQSAAHAAGQEALTQDDRNAIDHGIEAIEHMQRSGDWGDCCPQYVASLRKIAAHIATTPAPAHPLPVAGEEALLGKQVWFDRKDVLRIIAASLAHAAPAGEKGQAS